jgi:hypothetical protein
MELIGAGGSSDRALGSGPRVDDWRGDAGCESSQRRACVGMRTDDVVGIAIQNVKRGRSTVCRTFQMKSQG